jgi:hypothetical protein
MCETHANLLVFQNGAIFTFLFPTGVGRTKKFLSYVVILIHFIKNFWSDEEIVCVTDVFTQFDTVVGNEQIVDVVVVFLKSLTLDDLLSLDLLLLTLDLLLLSLDLLLLADCRLHLSLLLPAVRASHTTATIRTQMRAEEEVENNRQQRHVEKNVIILNIIIVINF